MGRKRKKVAGTCQVSKAGKKRKGVKCSGKSRSACKKVKSCAWHAK